MDPLQLNGGNLEGWGIIKKETLHIWLHKTAETNGFLLSFAWGLLSYGVGDETRLQQLFH